MLCAIAWIALGAAALYVVRTEQQLADRRAALRAFETASHDAADALGDVQAGQQAYVAAGQDTREWMSKVATYLQTASNSVEMLRTTALSPTSAPALRDAVTAAATVREVDRRLRQHLDANEIRAAADIVFADAADAVSSALSDIDAAIDAERQAADLFDSRLRRSQLYLLGSLAFLVAAVVGLLGLRPAESETSLTQASSASSERAAAEAAPVAAGGSTETAEPEVTVTWPHDRLSSSERLTRAADLCTELGRVREAEQLRDLLARSAEALGARGLIVWLGNTSGGDLRPVLAHGYSELTLSRLAPVSRDADNAAAAAYRTSQLQIVRSRRGESQGAVVAPLLGPDGCLGALTAEIREHGDETLADTRAVAAIIAAQLAGVLAPAAEESGGATSAEPHAAAG
jgi:hypothetical protein